MTAIIWALADLALDISLLTYATYNLLQGKVEFGFVCLLLLHARSQGRDIDSVKEDVKLLFHNSIIMKLKVFGMEDAEITRFMKNLKIEEPEKKLIDEAKKND